MDCSIDQISELPDIKSLMSTAQALALLDAIIMPEWDDRLFSFNANWDGCGKEMMASMRDGGGSEYFMTFNERGVVGKVFCGQVISDSIQQLEKIPPVFDFFKSEPAFSIDNASFYYWRESTEQSWHSSPAELKSYALLGFLVGGVEAYKRCVREYYEKEVNDFIVGQVFESLSVSESQLSLLNPDLKLSDLLDDYREIVG
jgi:hypothetical protein